MCGNNCFGGNNMWCIIILILLFSNCGGFCGNNGCGGCGCGCGNTYDNNGCGCNSCGC